MRGSNKIRDVVIAGSVVLAGVACAQQPVDASLFSIAQPTIAAGTETSTDLDKTLHVLAWPAYGLTTMRGTVLEDRTVLGRTQEFMLATERLGFFADAATTDLGLRTCCYEANRLNTLFGNRSQPGVIGSMTAWELGTSYASVAIPRRFERTRLRNPVRIATILADGYFAVQRTRTSIRNFHLVETAPAASTHP